MATTSSPSGLNDALGHGLLPRHDRDELAVRAPDLHVAAPARDDGRPGRIESRRAHWRPMSQGAEQRAGADVPHSCGAVLSGRHHPLPVGRELGSGQRRATMIDGEHGLLASRRRRRERVPSSLATTTSLPSGLYDAAETGPSTANVARSRDKMYAVLKVSSVCALGARRAASAARTRLSSGSTVQLRDGRACSCKRACASTRLRLGLACAASSCVRRVTPAITASRTPPAPMTPSKPPVAPTRQPAALLDLLLRLVAARHASTAAPSTSW